MSAFVCSWFGVGLIATQRRAARALSFPRGLAFAIGFGSFAAAAWSLRGEPSLGLVFVELLASITTSMSCGLWLNPLRPRIYAASVIASGLVAAWLGAAA